MVQMGSCKEPTTFSSRFLLLTGSEFLYSRVDVGVDDHLLGQTGPRGRQVKFTVRDRHSYSIVLDGHLLTVRDRHSYSIVLDGHLLIQTQL